MQFQSSQTFMKSDKPFQNLYMGRPNTLGKVKVDWEQDDHIKIYYIASVMKAPSD